MPPKHPSCAALYCPNTGSKTCTRCKRARYCSARCQRLDWPQHKGTCRLREEGDDSYGEGREEEEGEGWMEEEGEGDDAGEEEEGEEAEAMDQISALLAKGGAAVGTPMAMLSVAMSQTAKMHALKEGRRWPPPLPPPHPFIHVGLSLLCRAGSALGTSDVCACCGEGTANTPTAARRVCAVCRRARYCSQACLDRGAAAHGDECFAVVAARVANRDVHWRDAATEGFLRGRHTMLSAAAGARSTAGAPRERMLDARVVLGSFLGQLERAGEEAEALLQEALAGRTAALGGEHPHTLAALHALADVLAARGRLAGGGRLPCAVALDRHYSAALAALGRRHGARAPQTLAAANGHAELLRAMDRDREAWDLHTATFAARNEVLGSAHPATLSSVCNVISTHLGSVRKGTYWGASPLVKVQEALTNMRSACAAYHEVLGPLHPCTLRAQLALLQGWAGVAHLLAPGDFAGEEAAARAVLTRCREALGSRHALTLEALRALSAALQRAGGAPQGRAEAQALAQEVLAARREALGGEHSQTRAAQRELDSLLQARAGGE